MTTLTSSTAESSTVGSWAWSERFGSSVELAARLLLAAVFFYSAAAKVANYASVAAHMASYGVPGSLLPLVLATEVLFPVAIIVGWKTRIAAFFLLGYSILAAAIFHHNFGDPKETLAFFQDIGLIAGLLLLLAHGAGPVSLDRRLAATAVGE